jgi:hypothetical protein
MQSAKDSFYIALRDRLATLNPQRTVVVEGVTRPAILVRENEPAAEAGDQPNAFYLDWGPALALDDSETPVMQIACEVKYWTAGSSDGAGDRGRQLTALDEELLKICDPPRAALMDYSTSPATDLGRNVFWAPPGMKVKVDEQGRAQRTAEVNVFFLAENWR